jgi:hypothetical protein
LEGVSKTENRKKTVVISKIPEKIHSQFFKNQIMDLDKAEVAKHALKFLETIGIDPRSLNCDDDDRFTVSDTKTLKVGRKLIPPLDEESIREKLSSNVLSAELEGRFPELFDVRKSIIIRSHCINHAVIYDSDAPFEDIPENTEDSLVMASGIKLEDIDHFKAIIAGMRNKRLNVLKGGTRVKDDKYRDSFLFILTLCWTMSGADIREQEIIESKMTEEMVNESIKVMEEIIGDILSEFIFLKYKECKFGKILHLIT